MLAILSAVFGFAAPFLPELLKYFQRRQDNAQELALMDLRLKHAEKEHLWKMEEITATADIEESRVLRQPQQSFGVQILDKAHDAKMPAWVIVPTFWVFTLVDVAAAMVRPSVTYAAFGGYMAYKWAMFLTLTSERFGNSASSAIVQLWGEQDWAVLTLAMSYYFGLRSYKATFGGSASDARRSP